MDNDRRCTEPSPKEQRDNDVGTPKQRKFADTMKGWALVRIIGNQCSPQTIQTRCTHYEQYTTEEALKESAASYGGLTESPFLSPGR